MGMSGLTKCAVKGCGMPLSNPSNLCEEHRVPGEVMRSGSSTGVLTLWSAERDGQRGIIILNDFALGDLFGGKEGFKQQLENQGFTVVRIINTEEELETTKRQLNGRPLARWSGPWRMAYPWETV